MGCTSSGEISRYGYNQNSLIGLSIASEDFISVSEPIERLAEFSFTQGQSLCESLLNSIREKGKNPTPDNCFAFTLFDGVSVKEEYVCASLYESLKGIPFIGGSASDGDNFGETYVYHNGVFRKDIALITLIHTSYPFSLFLANNLIVTDEEFIVTEADVEKRWVTEINGLPAVQEYSRLVNLPDAEELSADTFAANPVALEVEEMHYTRAPLIKIDENTLQFACAIEEGIIYQMAKTGDLLGNLADVMSDVQQQIGSPELVLGCDCLFRTKEIEQLGIRGEVENIVKENNIFGFVTYGEQFGGLHNNQTLVGVAIGEKRPV